MMKFLRHLGAACLVVGLVTGAGVIWSHLGEFSLPGENGGGVQFRGGPPPTFKLPRGGKLPPGVKDVVRGPHGRITIIVNGNHGSDSLGLNSVFQRVNWPFVERTMVIEGAIIVAVVILSASHRRWRRFRRARSRPREPAARTT